MRDTYNDWTNEDCPLPEVKKCPFCGTQGILCDNGYEEPEIDSNGAYVGMDISEGDIFWVECDNCNAQGGYAETPEKAIENWDKRFFQTENVIHCKECKYAQMTYDGSCKYCDKFPELEDVYFPGDFYCGFAEKKEEK